MTALLPLTREWTTTLEVARARGTSRMSARRLLERMEARGLVERAVRGDGAYLWRFRPGLADRLLRRSVAR